MCRPCGLDRARRTECFTLFSLRDDQHRGNVPVFAQQDVERAAGRRRIHAFKTDAAAGQCEYQVARRQAGIPAGSEDYNFRVFCNEFREVVFGQCCHIGGIPAALNRLAEQNDVFTDVFVADLHHAFFDVSYGDGRICFADEFHGLIIAYITIGFRLFFVQFFLMSVHCLIFAQGKHVRNSV